MSKSNGMYYTPKEIIDPAAGTGNYLNVAADLLSNPPYAAQQSVQADAGNGWQKFTRWLRGLFTPRR